MKPNPLTKSARRRKKTAASQCESVMSPQMHETRLPPGYQIAPRPVCAPRAEERPLLRDERGRVLAVVEQWAPELEPS